MAGAEGRAFVERVAATLSARGMVVRGQSILVAFSGGPDSTALLHSLWRLRARLQCAVLACHIHHGLRGEAADADAQHAAEVADSLGIPFIEKRADVASYAKAEQISLETAARTLRYLLLEATAEELRVSRIATGHTADDQAETVLFNLLRGAGPLGLSGIPPVRGRIIRPLLDVTRAEVEAYCRAVGLAPRIDESNLDLRFARNRIRHEALPLLRRLQPNAVAALSRLADIMREENAYMASQVDWLVGAAVHRHDDEVAISLESFLASPLALQRRLIRRAVGVLRGNHTDLELERVDAVLRLGTAGETGSVVELPEGLRAERRYEEVVILRAPIECPSSGEWQLAVPGAVEIPGFGVEISAEVSEDLSLDDDPGSAVLDADTIGSPLRVRTWQPGDRFVPLGMQEPVKVQDFFVNAKVPRAQRHCVLLVESDGRIVWIVGFRIDDRSKVTEGTRRTIRLSRRRLQASRVESGE